MSTKTIGFPSSPAIDEEHQGWVWDGEKWVLNSVKGGGSGGGANVMKPHSQPFEWTTTQGYTFRHKARKVGTTQTVTMGENRMHSWTQWPDTGLGANKNILPTGTRLHTLNVPAGSKFLFSAFHTSRGNGIGPMRILMSSIKMDGVQLYPWAQNELQFNSSASSPKAFTWPGHQGGEDVGTNSFQYQQIHSQPPWEITSQLEFQTEIASTGEIYLEIMGYFQPA